MIGDVACGIGLRVHIFDQERGPFDAVVVTHARFLCTRPGEVNFIKASLADFLEASLSDWAGHVVSVHVNDGPEFVHLIAIEFGSGQADGASGGRLCCAGIANFFGRFGIGDGDFPLGIIEHRDQFKAQDFFLFQNPRALHRASADIHGDLAGVAAEEGGRVRGDFVIFDCEVE